MENISHKKLINPGGKDSLEFRSIILGDTSNINNFNNVRYKWALNLWNIMLGATWFPEKVDLSKDKLQYNMLTDFEKEAFDGTLGYLVFLDSINTYNPGKIAEYITAPEVSVLYARQSFDEVLHSKSYEVLLEEICDNQKKEYIYNYWRENEFLFKRIMSVAQHFDNFFDNSTLDNFSKSIVSMFLLEGLYFYVGFLYFYLLQSRELMQGSAAMIKYINRDEVNHVLIASNVIKAIRNEHPGVIKDEDIESLFKEAVEGEINWWHHIIGDNILGMSKNSISDYIYYLANKRLSQISYKKLFPDVKNPFKRLEELADIDGEGGVKENMFETTNTGYQQANTLKGLSNITF